MKKHTGFSKLLSDEVDLIFSDPSRITKAFKEQGFTLSDNETELLDILGSKVVESQPSPNEDALGFTRIVDFMSKLQKPIISHNGIMDLMFLYDKFFRPLPET